MAIHAREAHLPTLDEHRRREIGNELQATLNGWRPRLPRSRCRPASRERHDDVAHVPGVFLTRRPKPHSTSRCLTQKRVEEPGAPGFAIL
jgi:hypothetical protein